MLRDLCGILTYATGIILDSISSLREGCVISTTRFVGFTNEISVIAFCASYTASYRIISNWVVFNKLCSIASTFFTISIPITTFSTDIFMVHVPVIGRGGFRNKRRIFCKFANRCFLFRISHPVIVRNNTSIISYQRIFLVIL